MPDVVQRVNELVYFINNGGGGGGNASSVILVDDISGDFDGVETTFTILSSGVQVEVGSAKNILIALGGVVQAPNDAYTASGNTVTFSAAPPAGMQFSAIVLGDVEATPVSHADTADTANNALHLGGQLPAYYLDATNLTGTVPTARLGTGTANSTTFLAGDQTWKTIGALSVPNANSTVNGLMSITTQQFAGDKDFLGSVGIGGNTIVAGTLFVGFGGIADMEVTGNALFQGSGFHVFGQTTIEGAIITANTLSANGGVGSAGQVLTSGGAGQNTYWSTITVPSTPDANSTVSGFVNTAAQSLAGVKTWLANAVFSSNLTLTGTLHLANTVNANGGVGSALQVLTSGGAGANVYWRTLPTVVDANSTVAGLVNTSSQIFAGDKEFLGSLGVGGQTIFADKVWVGFGGIVDMEVTGNVLIQGSGTSIFGVLNVNELIAGANAYFQAEAVVNGTFSINRVMNANGSPGSAGQVLTSAGASANAYWRTIPDANTTVSGFVNTAAQSFAGNKTFTDSVTFTGSGTFTSGILTTFSNGVSFNGTMTANGDQGSAGQFLTTPGFGSSNAYWSTPPNANTTVNGYATTASQTFAGVKTFAANVVVSGDSLSGANNVIGQIHIANGALAIFTTNDRSVAGKYAQFYMDGHFARLAHSDFGTVVSWANTGNFNFANVVTAQILTCNGGAGFIQANDQSASGKFSYFYMAGHVGRIYHNDYGAVATWTNTGTFNVDFFNVAGTANITGVLTASANATVSGYMSASRFRSSSNTQTLSHATATTMHTIPATGQDRFDYFARIDGAVDDATNYTAIATVLHDGTTARLVAANNGGLLTITLSGLNVQVTQSSGTSQSILLTWARYQ